MEQNAAANIAAEERAHRYGLRSMSDEEFANYLERVGEDQRDSGRTYTAVDYEIAAERIREGANE